MTDQEAWRERLKAFRFYIGKIKQEKDGDLKLLDMVRDLIMAMDTKDLADVRDVMSDALKIRARNVMLLHDPEAFSEFMKDKW